jgi:hypothetical protein
MKMEEEEPLSESAECSAQTIHAHAHLYSSSKKNILF